MERGDSLRAIILCIILTLSLLSYAFAVEEDNLETTDSGATEDGLDSQENLDNSFSNVLEATSDTTSQKAAQWLSEQTSEEPTGIFDQSLAILAILSAGETDVSKYVENIKNAQDIEQGCWPSGGCKVKDTALATMAMYYSGQTTEAEMGIEWLKLSRSVNPAVGEWWIVIKATSGQGECSITWDGARQPKVYTLEGDVILESPGKYYINVANLNPSLLRQLMKTITVDCNTDSIIALIYKPAVDRYFIQKSESISHTDLILSNACFGETKNSRCDFESTAYATWALLETGSQMSLEEIGTSIYLQSKVKENDITQLALLNRLLYKSGSIGQSFVQQLASLQRPDGSWGTNIFITSIASLALNGNSEHSDKVTHSLAYLQKKQAEDGSWNQKVKETSMALIALNGPDFRVGNVGSISRPRSGGSTEDCSDDLDGDGDGFSDCADSDCITYLTAFCNNNVRDRCEEDRDCGGSVCGSCEESDLPPAEPECQTDSDCSIDETCIRGNCQFTQSNITPPPLTTEDEGGFPWLLTFIIVIIIVGLVFFYIKYIRTGKVDLKSLFKKKSPVKGILNSLTLTNFSIVNTS